MLKEYVPTDYYKEGCLCDAQDTVHNWCLSEIVGVNGREINVHFDGWPDRWDEVSVTPFNPQQWYKGSSYKVAPFRKYTKGYTGQ